MASIARWMRWLATHARRLGVCGNGGIIVGVLAGGALALLDFLEGGGLALSTPQALRVWLVLAVFGWLTLLFVFVAFVRWKLSTVLMPALVNAALVVGTTVYVCRSLDLYHLGVVIGMLAGMLIGALLCAVYKRIAHSVRNDGLYRASP